MAAPSSPKQPIYHSPSLALTRRRRSSTRKSFTSHSIPSAPLIGSPRTLCPRDGDAFSYNPAHLSEWYMLQDLWDNLPPKLQSSLVSMQHSGAAVLTGFERLDQHTKEHSNGQSNHKLVEDELLVQLDALPPPKLRTTSTASSTPMTEIVSSEVIGTPASETASPFSSGSQSTSPVSPICLSPLDHMDFEARECSRDRSFSTRSRDRSFSGFLEPHDSYYAAELSYLRTEALPRLRHAARKVETEYSEAKRSSTLSGPNLSCFDEWWTVKKSTILNLNNKCKHLSHAIGLSPSGMGWTYAP